MRNDLIVYQFFYPATHRRCGLPCYVGKGKRTRPNDHIRNAQNKQLRSLFKRYGNLPLLIVRENLSENEAIKLEIALIKAIGRVDKGEGFLLNHTDGGEGVSGLIHKDITKRQQSERVSKRFQDPDERRRASKSSIVAMARPEVIAAHSAGQRRRYAKSEEIEKNRQRNLGYIWITNKSETKKIKPFSMIPDGWYRGRTMRRNSPEGLAKRRASMGRSEVKAAISVGQLRRFVNIKEREKVRLAKLGQKHSLETRRQMSLSHTRRYEDQSQREEQSKRMRLWWKEKRENTLSTKEVK